MTGICKESLNCGLIQEDLCCGKCNKLQSCEWVCNIINDPFDPFDFTECEDYAESSVKQRQGGTLNGCLVNKLGKSSSEMWQI